MPNPSPVKDAAMILERIKESPSTSLEPFQALFRLKMLVLDLSNTVNAIADPDDYEAGGEKTAETCRRLAAECIERNNL